MSLSLSMRMASQRPAWHIVQIFFQHRHSLVVISVSTRRLVFVDDLMEEIVLSAVLLERVVVLVLGTVLDVEADFLHVVIVVGDNALEKCHEPLLCLVWDRGQRTSGGCNNLFGGE